MAKVALRQRAIDDLNNIWFYTFEEWSEKQADKYYATLEFTCMEIEKTHKEENRENQRQLTGIENW